MKTLPNGLAVFNATPHVIRFWREDWPEPVEVEPDEAINAEPMEAFAGGWTHEEMGLGNDDDRMAITFVRTAFVGNQVGKAIAEKAKVDGAHVVVGSIIAAQAYPGLVVAMTPAPGYERKPPAEKRMNPDKFTTFWK